MAEDSKPAKGLKTIVAASAAGTTFEWYDFFIFGTLTAIITKTFFAGVSGTLGTILTLSTFAVGLIARPIGALVFGHIGDKAGRKGTFLWTILVMGVATIAIGCLPTYAQIGNAAPLLLVALRVIQGFALGGEYGGAAIYVAEHAPADKRGGYTGWIQTSAAFGLIAALLVVIVTEQKLGEAAFAAWGWRIPFWVSAGLLIVTVYVRARTAESPAFKALEAAGKVSKSPLGEVFSNWNNLKTMLIALFSFMTAQGVIWYTCFFYTQVFLTKLVRLSDDQTHLLVIGMTIVSAFFYITFARLSDMIGRKPVMLAGIVLACATLFPGYHMLVKYGNPDLEAASRASPVAVVADPAQCTFQFNLFGTATYSSACDLARSVVTNIGVPYVEKPAPAGSPATIAVGGQQIAVGSAQGLDKAGLKALTAKTTGDVKAALKAAGYPDKADPAKAQLWPMFAVLCVLAIACTALYGPMASALVEMFPTRVRYTALSIPYNIGTGWFGGIQPALSFAMVAATGDIYFGLWYPVITGILAVLVALVFMKETRGRDLHAIEY